MSTHGGKRRTPDAPVRAPDFWLPVTWNDGIPGADEGEQQVAISGGLVAATTSKKQQSIVHGDGLSQQELGVYPDRRSTATFIAKSGCGRGFLRRSLRDSW